MDFQQLMFSKLLLFSIVYFIDMEKYEKYFDSSRKVAKSQANTTHIW